MRERPSRAVAAQREGGERHQSGRRARGGSRAEESERSAKARKKLEKGVSLSRARLLVSLLR